MQKGQRLETTADYRTRLEALADRISPLRFEEPALETFSTAMTEVRSIGSEVKEKEDPQLVAWITALVSAELLYSACRSTKQALLAKRAFYHCVRLARGLKGYLSR